MPGGPIEQIIANLEGQGDVFESFAGTGDDSVVAVASRDDYVGARITPEFIEELEKESGFDKPPLERFLHMLWNYRALTLAKVISVQFQWWIWCLKNAGFHISRVMVHSYRLFGLHPAWYSKSRARWNTI